MRITDVLANCECGWSGTVGECEPDIDGDGGLGCPKCFSILNVLGPPKLKQKMKISFRKENSHYSDDDIAWLEMEHIQTPNVGDSVNIKMDSVTNFGGEVVKRRFFYDLNSGETEVIIWLSYDN